MSNKLNIRNTSTDTSANAGAEGAVAQGRDARYANVGANQITVSGGGDVKVSDSSPEVLAAAFNFGRDALTALQSNTERQVSGAVDAARQATEAASRLATGDSINAAKTAAEAKQEDVTAPKLAALSPVTIGLLLAAALAAFLFFGRSPK